LLSFSTACICCNVFSCFWPHLSQMPFKVLNEVIVITKRRRHMVYLNFRRGPIDLGLFYLLYMCPVQHFFTLYGPSQHVQESGLLGFDEGTKNLNSDRFTFNSQKHIVFPNTLK
jgi:hypothetical protein